MRDDFIIFDISVARCASSVSDLIAGKGVSTAAVSWLFNHDILVYSKVGQLRSWGRMGQSLKNYV
jgi:hypothetical protein